MSEIEEEESGDVPDGVDDVDVMRALRSAMAPPNSEPKSIAKAVQKKIRDESKGRYFADGWSTANAPGGTFLVTSVLMLVIVILAWFLLSPQGLELLKLP